MELQLRIIGALFILLALVHVIFPKYFRWREELEGLTLVNRQMMYIHTFFIGLMVLLMGIFCLTSAPGIVSTPLGKRVSLGFGLFWLARAYIQFFGYSRELWRGKRRETGIHIIFSIFWLYCTSLFLAIYFM